MTTLSTTGRSTAELAAIEALEDAGAPEALQTCAKALESAHAAFTRANGHSHRDAYRSVLRELAHAMRVEI